MRSSCFSKEGRRSTLDTVQEDLVQRAQAGDSEVFIQLVKSLDRRMYSMAKSMVRNDEDCADAMQETVLKAFRAISGLKEAAYFNTWLFRILINECNMILRRRDRVVVMSDPPESIESSSSTAEKTRLHRARKTLYQSLAQPVERKVNV
ncbi:sigma-70 family RNA polymerase sigma factor [Paenibacillus sp. IHB B 3415]|uniref:sigma-70 family RNA polymerase sigma factor n=1 Tax=Paenibacillus sp. IHB B 3415 TaxID=867080 RepID=UPI000B22EA42|nr:sigma-70 family RNA polymerase sigma factor [Paenibacillus sp. IHB B 3415]